MQRGSPVSGARATSAGAGAAAAAGAAGSVTAPDSPSGASVERGASSTQQPAALTRQGARCLGPRHLAHTARVLLLSAGDDQPRSWPPAKGCACRPPGPHWAQPGPATVAPGCGLGSACPHSHGRSTQASWGRAWGQHSRWGPSDTGVCSSGRRVSRAQGQGKRPGVRNPAPHPGFTSWTVDGRSLPRGAACSPGSRNVGTFRPRSSVRMGHGVC